MQPIPPVPIPAMPSPWARSWWIRNWKWFVPVAGLGGLLALVGFGVFLFSLVGGLLKSSDAYKMAVDKARASPAVIQAIGTPIKEGYFLTGHISMNGSSGKANLAIPISGPDGKATLYVDATKSMGQWSFRQLVVEIEKTGRRIDISGPSPQAE